MSIIINKKTRVLIQGITGHQGSASTKHMKDFGTKIVAGVTPGKGGLDVGGVPVYNSVREALKEHDADFSIVFVPPSHAKDAAIESLSSGLNIIIITEGVPVHDTLAIVQTSEKKNLFVIGPNCPGLCSAGECNISIMPNNVFKKGHVGVVSRSGTLTFEMTVDLSEAGFGESTVIGIGGDPVVGTNFIDILELFEKDKQTKKIVLVGEIGGNLEEKAAEYIKEHVTKPVVAYITGQTAPPGKRMGHAGAIISGCGTAQEKMKVFEKNGIPVAKLPGDVPKILKNL